LEIIVAKTAGFCFGVKRAIELTEKALVTDTKVYSVGSIVHNKFVNSDLMKKGLIFVDNIEDVPDGSNVIIRAHGITSKEMIECEKKNLLVVDTTCPNVKNIHDIVHRYSDEGYFIIIIGDENHPEVIGISGWTNGNFRVINRAQDIDLCNLDKVCVVSQTTMNVDNNKIIVDEIKLKAKECVIFDTICKATENRQKELKSLVQDADYVIVIGDKSSANSNRLYEIAKNVCNSQFIENIDELDLNFLEQSCKIVVMAGASTPQRLIDEVVENLKNYEGIDRTWVKK